MADEGSDAASAEYVVEYIEHARFSRKIPGTWEYWTKWYGYPDDENCYQATKDMKGAETLVDSFWNNVGAQHRDMKQYRGVYDRELKFYSTPSWRKKQSASTRKTIVAEGTEDLDEVARVAAEKEARRREKLAKNAEKARAVKAQNDKERKKAEASGSTSSSQLPKSASMPALSSSKASSSKSSSAAPPPATKPLVRANRRIVSSSDSSELSEPDDDDNAKSTAPRTSSATGKASTSSSAAMDISPSPSLGTPATTLSASRSVPGTSMKPQPHPLVTNLKPLKKSQSSSSSKSTSKSTSPLSTAPAGPVASGSGSNKPAGSSKPTTAAVPKLPPPLPGFQKLRSLPIVRDRVVPAKRKSLHGDELFDGSLAGSKKRQTPAPDSDSDEGAKTRHGSPESESGSSEFDPLFDGSQETQQSGSQPGSSRGRKKRTEGSRSRSRSSSPDEPLARRASGQSSTPPVASPVIPPSTLNQVFFRKKEQQADKHRGSKIKLMHDPLVKPKSYGLPSKTGSTSAASPISTTPTTALEPKPSGSGIARPTVITSTSAPAPVVSSPVPMDMDLDLPSFDFDQGIGPSSPMASSSPGPSKAAPAPRGSTSSTAGRRKSAMDVTESIESHTTSAPILPAPKLKAMTFTKKWKGALCIRSPDSPLCEIQYEAKTSATALGLAFRQMTSVVIEKQFEEHVFLSLILPAFEPITEHGIINGVDQESVLKLDKWTRYLGDKAQVAFIRPDVKHTQSAFFLLFPSTLTNVAESLSIKTTSTVPNKPSLVLAMLQKSRPNNFPETSSVPSYPSEWVTDLRKLVGGNVQYQRAARYFKVAPDLLKMLQDCPFSVFNEHSRHYRLDTNDTETGAGSGDVEKPVEDAETLELVSLLTRPRTVASDGFPIARRSDWRDRHPAPACVMFVHADSWPKRGDDTLPEWMAMRDLDIDFFRYGEPSVKEGLFRGEESPAVRPVFPQGTCVKMVLTFTPGAFLADTEKTVQIIEDAAESGNDIETYLHPNTIGLLQHMIETEQNPTRKRLAAYALARIEFLLTRYRILHPDPPLCITQCPPPLALRVSSDSGSADLGSEKDIMAARVAYLKRYQFDAMTIYPDHPQLLFRESRLGLAKNGAYVHDAPIEDGINGSVDAIAGNGAGMEKLKSIGQLSTLVAEACADDLGRMMLLPTMYENYRHFVLVHGGRDEDEPVAGRKSGIKMVSIAEYSAKTFGTEKRVRAEDPFDCPWGDPDIDGELQ